MTAPPPADSWREAQPFPGSNLDPRGRTRELALVLEARGIPHRIGLREGRRSLLVPTPLHARATEELRCYDAENRHHAQPQPRPPVTANNSKATIAALLSLGLFHDLTMQPPGRVAGIAVDWHRLGMVDAQRIEAGEIWRLVTALTLHADGPHLAGNLLLGGILVTQLNQQLGVGLGMALLVLAGTLGNLSNILLRPGSHLSLGASTAVFAALGCLTARTAWETHRGGWRRWIVPLGAGAGLVAFTGSGGHDTDYLAHLCGFGWGLVTGTLTCWPRPLRRPLGWKTSAGLGWGTLTLCCGAWAWAIWRG